MSFEIVMEKKAQKFLKEKGNVLTISRMDIKRGCMSVEEVDITYKEPKDGNYEKYEYDEAMIYVQKGLQFKDDRINIVISGIGPFKTIAAGTLKRGIL